MQKHENNVDKKKIVIEPVTRLEGEAKISIFLDDDGNVENAFFQVVELRGFERFCIGRPAEELPRITSKICGVCSWAHHLASVKALDMLFDAPPPKTAHMIREMAYCAHMIHSHLAHFYVLAGPDFFIGPTADPAMRNIFGILERFPNVAKEVIKNRAYAQKIQEIVGGKPIHPVSGLPGGVSKQLTKEEQKKIEEYGKSFLEFSKTSLDLFESAVLRREDLSDLFLSDTYNHRTYYMSIVDKNNNFNFYDGKIRVIDPNGREFAKFDAKNYLDYIEEHVEPWTYLKFPYLKSVGWKGIKDGEDSGVYRVNSLARLNVSDSVATPLAKEAAEKMYDTLGEKPAHNTFAFNWARLVEIMYASERLLELITDDEILDSNIRADIGGVTGLGIGTVEAPRGTLYHHYETDDEGLITGVNLIVATVQNNAGICMSIRKAAQEVIKNWEVSEGILNRVEMAFRAYDPCLACASHSLVGQMPMEINIFTKDGKLYKQIRRS